MNAGVGEAQSHGAVRGYIVNSFVEYLVDRVPDGRQRLEARPELWNALPLDGPKHCPAELFALALDAVASSEPDPEERFRLLVRCGEFAAQQSLNTFFRLLMKVMTAGLFVRKFPDMWRRDFLIGEGHARTLEKQRLEVTLEGVGQLEMLVPIGLGWMNLAFAGMGYDNARIRVLEPADGALSGHRIRYEVAWD